MSYSLQNCIDDFAFVKVESEVTSVSVLNSSKSGREDLNYQTRQSIEAKVIFSSSLMSISDPSVTGITPKVISLQKYTHRQSAFLAKVS